MRRKQNKETQQKKERKKKHKEKIKTSLDEYESYLGELMHIHSNSTITT